MVDVVVFVGGKFPKERLGGILRKGFVLDGTEFYMM